MELATTELEVMPTTFDQCLDLYFQTAIGSPEAAALLGLLKTLNRSSDVVDDDE